MCKKQRFYFLSFCRLHSVQGFNLLDEIKHVEICEAIIKMVQFILVYLQSNKILKTGKKDLNEIYCTKSDISSGIFPFT